tara:strand:- start:6101 stop:6892 length:792 start_codon:yes stop_codon:yes gene_type:complete
MSRLYIFGDSWALSPAEEFVDDPKAPQTWQFELMDKLQCSKIQFAAGNGTSIDWAMHHYWKLHTEIKENDYIVFVMTHPSRTWLLQEHPELANIWMNQKGWPISSQEKKAIEMYRRYLNNKENIVCRLKSASIALSYDAMHRRAKVIQVPGFTYYDEGELTSTMLFNPWCEVEGSLEIIGGENFDATDKLKAQVDMVTKSGTDNRLNHMTWDNHSILAEKLYQSFENRKPLHLQVGISNDIIFNDVEEWKNYNSDILHNWKAI